MKATKITMETFPYRLNVEAMRIKFKAQRTYAAQLNLLINLMAYKETGLITVKDFREIMKSVSIHENYWVLHTSSITTDQQLLLFGKLATFAEQCGRLRVSGFFRKIINEQLEIIYKNTI